MKNKIFADGFCFKKIFIFFVLGCLLGTFYEEILDFIKSGVWESRKGLLWGPFNPIYGFGVLVLVLFLGKHYKDRGIFKTFIYATLIGGITEYLTSLIADRIFGIEFWDYSNRFLNIGGRTTIPYMLGWGLAGLILIKVIYPFLSKLIHKNPN